MEAETTAQSTHLEEVEVEKLRVVAKVFHLKASLARCEGKLVELEASNINLNTARDEAIVGRITFQVELNFCKSDRYKKNIINDFKSSIEYGAEIGREAGSFLDKGCAHIICQLYHYFEDKSILLRAFEANFDNEACRRGTDFFPVALCGCVTICNDKKMK